MSKLQRGLTPTKLAKKQGLCQPTMEEINGASLDVHVTYVNPIPNSNPNPSILC